MFAGKRVLLTRRIPFLAERLQAAVVEGLEVVPWLCSEPHENAIIARRELLQSIPHVDGLLCFLTDRVDDEVLSAAGPALKVVSSVSVGFDHISVQACSERAVKVGHTPGVLSETTAETTVALLFATTRRVPDAVAAVKDGRWGTWDPFQFCGTDVSGSTVGIIGLGGTRHFQRIAYAERFH
jgi:lactate dehydrogenase-like 2-hydroxyacid dehydrogenase